MQAAEKNQDTMSGIGEDEELAQGVVAMLNKVGVEMNGVSLLSKTRDTLLTLATTARLGVTDVVGLSVSDMREHLDDLNSAVAGSVGVLEMRRFERWAGVMAPAETTRTILQEAMEVEELGSWEVAGANTGPKFRITSAVFPE